MTHAKLVPIRFENGMWEGHLATDTAPRIEAWYQGRMLPGVTCDPAEGGWTLRVPVPVALLSEGIHIVVIRAADSGDILGDFAMIGGTAAADELGAQVELLRAELDMLKQVVRRLSRRQD